MACPNRSRQLAKEPEKLEELPGIGDRMVEHIQEIVEDRRLRLRKKLLKKYPATMLDMLNLQSLGPKKVAFLWSNFKAATVADVEKIAKEGKLRDLPGFGEKSEQNILKAVEDAQAIDGTVSPRYGGSGRRRDYRAHREVSGRRWRR